MNILKHRRYLIFIVFFLFLGSYTNNLFLTSSPKWFQNFQLDSASIPIYTQIIHFNKHKNTNVKSTGGLSVINDYFYTKCYLWSDKQGFKNCYNQQINNPKLNKSTLYIHNSGLSTTLTLRPIWYLVHFFKTSTHNKWKIDYFATKVSNIFLGAMTALVITLTILWIYLEFNFITASMVFLYLFLFSPWLTIMSHNVYWVIYPMFIPFLLSAHIYYYKLQYKILILFILFVIFSLWNSLAHFEYTPSFLIFSMLPPLYYEFKEQESIKQSFVNLTILSIALLLGFILSIAIFLLQLHIVKLDGIGNLVDVMSYRLSNSFKGTDPLVLASQKASYFSVLKTYIRTIGKYSNSYLVEYPLLILLFIGSIILVFNKTLYCKQAFTLLLSTWVSLLVPLSWFILAKPHSFVHTHINFILWTFCNIFIFIFISYIMEEFKKHKI